MKTETKIALYEVLNRYRGKPLIYGETDCNLLFLELFEPEKYLQFVGKYKTIKAGAKVALSVFGYSTVKQFLAESEDYQEIRPGFQLPLDILVFPGHDISFITDSGAFGIDPNKTFSHFPLTVNNYKIYRRV